MCAATHVHLIPNIQIEGENLTQVRCSQKLGKPVLTRIKRSVFFVTVCQHALESFPVLLWGYRGHTALSLRRLQRLGQGSRQWFFPLSQFVLPSPPHEGSTLEWLGFQADFSCGWVVKQQPFTCDFPCFSAGPSFNFSPTRHGGGSDNFLSSTSAKLSAKPSITGCFVFQAGGYKLHGGFSSRVQSKEGHSNPGVTS